MGVVVVVAVQQSGDAITVVINAGATEEEVVHVKCAGLGACGEQPDLGQRSGEGGRVGLAASPAEGGIGSTRARQAVDLDPVSIGVLCLQHQGGTGAGWVGPAFDVVGPGQVGAGLTVGELTLEQSATGSQVDGLAALGSVGRDQTAAPVEKLPLGQVEVDVLKVIEVAEVVEAVAVLVDSIEPDLQFAG